LNASASERIATAPSNSRMLTGYLTDIEQLLEEQRFDAALRDAAELPCIAVALSDPELRCSQEAVGMWVSRWLKPSGAEASTAGVGGTQAPAGGVPASALRRLQLRRHIRTLPRGYSAAREPDLNPHAAASDEAGRALVSAARRWYARAGCHDATVQTNLARLAVLR